MDVFDQIPDEVISYIEDDDVSSFEKYYDYKYRLSTIRDECIAMAVDNSSMKILDHILTLHNSKCSKILRYAVAYDNFKVFKWAFLYFVSKRGVVPYIGVTFLVDIRDLSDWVKFYSFLSSFNLANSVDADRIIMTNLLKNGRN
jgi:hypothetical protein